MPVFGGNFFEDFTDEPVMSGPSFHFHVNDLKTRGEILQWYLDLNTGGTVHTEGELSKVKELITNKVPYTCPPREELIEQAGLNRGILAKTVQGWLVEKERIANENRKAEEAQAAKLAGKKGRKK